MIYTGVPSPSVIFNFNGITHFPVLQQQFVFTLPEVEIIEKLWMFDFDAVFADIGGFLGLLLGTSILGLTELILVYCSRCANKESG